MNSNTSIDKYEILIVDDTPEQIEMAMLVLKSNNYKVRVATRGAAALKLLEKQIPDLILLDIFMPEIDGFELCKLIKANENFKNIPVIFLTSSDDEDSIRKGFESGAQDYVTKPFNTTELLARVNTHIKLKEQTESLYLANRELDSFCYSIAHDLKAPLLSVRKLIDYLSLDYTDKLGEDGNSLIMNIQKKSAELTGIIDHLLEFSRMCEMEMNFEPVNLHMLIRNVFDELMLAEPQRIAKLNLARLPEITGDGIMLRILMTNILSNALKYTSPLPAAIIDIDYTEHQNDYVFCISDNGVGFDMKYSSRLFQVFQRLHSSKEFEGSGVGLSICQRILKRHNGRAWMTGEVNNGASFYFSFPK
ncbi:MAG: response regulator receiver sensor signal transduction histidine kinase [Eubacterium sp.]|nr:response regulator receiver sensor signal transduction histidine kinase [Eubacterium sp.]